MEEIDTWRVANVLLKDYGDEAVAIAAKRAAALHNQGDTDRS